MVPEVVYAVFASLAWLRRGPPTQQALNDLVPSSSPAAMMPDSLPSGLDLLDTSIGEIASLMNNGMLSSETLVATYLGASRSAFNPCCCEVQL